MLNVSYGNKMKLVIFDVDGTLTETVQADEECFVQALREVFGFTDVDTDWASYPYCTDSGILETLCQQRLGRSPSGVEASSFQSHFLSLLILAAAAHPFSPIAGAKDIILSLISSPTFVVSIASGAWECSARFKLANANLHFACIPAAFSDCAHSREAIMQASVARAAEFYSRPAFDDVVYVGDGLWDARASRNLGVSFVGISRDRVKVERLYAEGAVRVFLNYLDKDAVLNVLTSA
jgi:phosphoglycolate phosphatase-like HAD superfamily hydrolase